MNEARTVLLIVAVLFVALVTLAVVARTYSIDPVARVADFFTVPNVRPASA